MAAPSTNSARHRILVIGGGFAGLNAVKATAKLPVDITLVDRRNFHLFQPLLYQVASGGLSPGIDLKRFSDFQEIEDLEYAARLRSGFK